jgi:hypothetical protein
MKTLKEHDVVTFKYKDSHLTGTVVHVYPRLVPPAYEIEVDNETYTVSAVNIPQSDELGAFGKSVCFIIPFFVCSSLVYVWIAMAVTWWANH